MDNKTTYINYYKRLFIIVLSVIGVFFVIFFLPPLVLPSVSSYLPTAISRPLQSFVSFEQSLFPLLFPTPQKTAAEDSSLEISNTENLNNFQLSSQSINFNIPVTFKEGITIQNQNVDLGTGQITASNILYGLTPGVGITITDGQEPTISNAGVLSLGGATGAVTLQAGGGISVAGNTITNTGILSLAAGSGISVSGNSISNSDPGSAQEIFKTISVAGQEDIVAGDNDSELTFAAGTGMAITTDPDTNTLTLSASASTLNVSGWEDNGTDVVLQTSTDNVGLGTSSPTAKLHVVGTSNTTGLATFGAGINVNGETITDFTGTGLQLVSGSLQTTLGTSVDLTSEVTGVLPIANGGTGNSTAFTAGSVIFSDGTKLTENNANFFWDNTNARLGIGSTSPLSELYVVGTGTFTSNLNVRENLWTDKLIESANPQFVRAHNEIGGHSTGVTWTQAGTNSLPTEIFGATTFVYDGKMWIIGGHGFSSVPTRKVYYSTNGTTWTEAGSNSLPIALDYLSGTIFDGKMWITGGSTGAALSQKTYYSTDGITWTEAGTNTLPIPLYEHSMLVYDGKMWLLGGVTTSNAANRKVYYSSNGTTWTEAGTNALPLAVVDNHGAVVYEGKMWVIGGFDASGSFSRKVYYSTDGATWTEAGTNALPSARSNHGAVVYDGKMWVIGGYTGSGVWTRDVYYSTTGSSWTQAGTNAFPITGSPMNQVVVYDGKIWVIGPSSDSLPTAQVYYTTSTIIGGLRVDDPSGNNLMNLDTSGNLSIGNANGSTVDINGYSSDIYFTGGGEHYIYFGEGEDQFIYNFISDGSLNIETSSSGGDIILTSRGGNGEVGINEYSPAYDLDIGGDLRSQESAYFATTSGGVGIGTTSIAAKLHTVAQSEQFRLAYTPTAFTSFFVDSVGELSISPNISAGNTTRSAVTFRTFNALGSADELFQVANQNTDLFTILGNGDTSITGTLDISSYGAIGDQASISSIKGLNVAQTFSGTTATGSYAVFGEARMTPASNSSNSTYGTFGWSRVPSTTTVDIITGVGLGGQVSHESSGTLSNALGVESVVFKSSSGPITNAFGLYTRIDNLNASGAITNAYGLFISDSTETGTITNDYGVYQVDTGAINYFGGNVGVGTTAPNYKTSILSTLSSADGAIASITNNNTTDSTNTTALRLNVGVTSTTTNARFIRFYGGVTSGDTGGTAVGSISINNNAVAYNTSGADFAEYADMAEQVSYGDIIATTSRGNVKATENTPLIGVVSDTAGFIGNAKTDKPGANQAIMGFVGHIKTKVSTINGPIRVGDPIAASSIPGVGKKATSAGYIIGKALESYENSDPNAVKRIQVMVTVSWYDPAIILTELGDIVSGLQNTTTAANQTINQTTVTLSSLDFKVKTLEAQYASLSAQLSSASTAPTVDLTAVNASLATLTTDTTSNTNRITSLESELASLKNQVLGASTSAQLTASNSATIASASALIDEKTATLSSLLVTGKSNLNDLSVMGTFTNGLLSINGLDNGAATISSLGAPLKIQNNLSANVEFMNGMIVMDTKGNMTVKEITVKKINVDTSDTPSTTLGEAVIKAGDTQVVVKSTAVTSKSQIFVTSKTKVTSPVAVTSQTAGDTFTIELSAPQTTDVKVSWWIVN